jgi:hypothetical protein
MRLPTIAEKQRGVTDNIIDEGATTNAAAKTDRLVHAIIIITRMNDIRIGTRRTKKKSMLRVERVIQGGGRDSSALTHDSHYYLLVCLPLALSVRNLFLHWFDIVI